MDNITLNVGGTVFIVGKSTLLKCEFFRNIFEDTEQTDEPLFIDRGGHIFKHILGHLRSNNYPYPKKYADELDYFLINKEGANLYNPVENFVNIIHGTECSRCESPAKFGSEYCDEHASLCDYLCGATDRDYCDKPVTCININKCAEHGY